MVKPERPQADAYDDNEQVQAHFSETPGLTKLPQNHRYYNIGRRVKREIGELYTKYSFEKGERYGLFWAGSPSVTKYEDRTKTLLLVVELKENNLKDWWKLDDEVRAILKKYNLSGRHQVCVRYYQYWEGYNAEEVEEIESEGQIVRARALRPSRPLSPRHDSVALPEPSPLQLPPRPSASTAESTPRPATSPVLAPFPAAAAELFSPANILVEIMGGDLSQITEEPQTYSVSRSPSTSLFGGVAPLRRSGSWWPFSRA